MEYVPFLAVVRASSGGLGFLHWHHWVAQWGPFQLYSAQLKLWCPGPQTNSGMAILEGIALSRSLTGHLPLELSL